MNNSSFEKILEKDGRLVYSSHGVSMRPLIREGRDLLIVERPQGRLKKYDVPLYRRGEGQYVLHRILKVREHDYVICGDNLWVKETGITDEQIIGVLTAVIRDGKELSVNDWRYRLYVHLWCDLFPLRALIIRGVNWIRRWKQRL